MTVDTGCSTSLTALHLGCQSIRTKESKTSIVGGASLMLNPDMFISMSSLGSETPVRFRFLSLIKFADFLGQTENRTRLIVVVRVTAVVRVWQL